MTRFVPLFFAGLYILLGHTLSLHAQVHSFASREDSLEFTGFQHAFEAYADSHLRTNEPPDSCEEYVLAWTQHRYNTLDYAQKSDVYVNLCSNKQAQNLKHPQTYTTTECIGNRYVTVSESVPVAMIRQTTQYYIKKSEQKEDSLHKAFVRFLDEMEQYKAGLSKDTLKSLFTPSYTCDEYEPVWTVAFSGFSEIPSINRTPLCQDKSTKPEMFSTYTYMVGNRHLVLVYEQPTSIPRGTAHYYIQRK